MEIKEFEMDDTKLVSLPKNFKHGLPESAIRHIEKYGTFLTDDDLYGHWSWRKKIFQKLWRFISKKR